MGKLGHSRVMVQALICFLVSCQVGENEQRYCNSIQVDDAEYCVVSLYEVIVRPEKFIGQQVRLVGYLNFDLDSAVIGPDFESVQGFVIDSDVVVLLMNERQQEQVAELDGKLVAVYGKFSFCEGEIIPRKIEEIVEIREF